ncbi:MAG: ROK family protein [Coprobacillus sp.]
MSIAVFDVGGTFIKYAEIHKDIIMTQGKVSTPRDNQENFLKAIENVLSELSSHVEGIAFSLPGVIDVKRKYIFAGGSLRYHDHCYIQQWEERFQLPIELENDARCAAMAELSKGNMQGIEKGIVLTFGTGIGGGIIMNGDIYKGSHLIAGEVSVLMTKDMRKYGTHAAWGARCGTVNLIQRIAEVKGISDEDGKEVFSWVERNDEESMKIFEEFCYDIVVQLHNIQCLLDPQRICIGGGISSNPLFIEGIKKAQKEFYAKIPIEFPYAEIYKCEFGNDANLIGAYQHYIKAKDL